MMAEPRFQTAWPESRTGIKIPASREGHAAEPSNRYFSVPAQVKNQQVAAGRGRDYQLRV